MFTAAVPVPVLGDDRPTTPAVLTWGEVPNSGSSIDDGNGYDDDGEYEYYDDVR